MKRLGLTLSACCCAMGLFAQTFGDMYRAKGKYEIQDTVYVTKYVNGVPHRNYRVTGDDKLRIMKAIGFMLDVYTAETVPAEDRITTAPLYAYMRNVAPLDSGTVYEIAPFFRYQMAPYRNFYGNGRRNRSHIGGILIREDKNDSTVVLGTVHRSVQGRDSVFAYPYQYVKAVPVQGQGTLDEVQALRKLMKRMHKYEIPFVGYGTPWQLENPGMVTVKWYRKGVVKRQRTIHSDRLMPMLGGYLRTIDIDKTGRSCYRTVVLPGGYRPGMVAHDFTRECHNSYADIIKGDCIEIVFPSMVRDKHLGGLLITTGDTPAVVYGLMDNDIVGAPYLFYSDRYTTRRLSTWLKENGIKP